MILPAFSFLIAAAAAQAPEQVAYRMEFTARNGRPRIVAELTVRGSDSGVTTLTLPSRWANQDSLWRSLDSLSVSPSRATLGPGTEPWLRRVTHRPGERLRVRWVIQQDFQGELDRRNWYRALVQPDWFFFTGYSAVVIPGGEDDVPVALDLSWRLPRGATAATSHGAGNRIRTRTSRREIRHAIYAGGAFRLERRRVGATELTVATRLAHRFSDAEFADGVARVMRAELEFWNDAGPPSYLVTAIPAGEGGNFGGTRLNLSFATFLGPEVAMDAPLLRLVAHELMHEWIGGRLRAAGNPEATGYWFSEGFTDFFTDRALLRAGLWTDSSYAEVINATLREHALSSTRHAPFDSVAARFWTGRDAGREPYLRGHVVALLLDREIRTATGGTQSLESLIRDALAAAGPGGVTMTDSAIVRLLAPSIGPAAQRIIAEHVRAGTPMTLPPDLLGSCFTHSPDSVAPFALGFDLGRSRAARALTGVDPAGPAWAAGLRDGMPLRGLSVVFGDTSREAEFVVEVDGERRTVRYLPMGAGRVRVERFAPAPGGC